MAMNLVPEIDALAKNARNLLTAIEKEEPQLIHSGPLTPGVKILSSEVRKLEEIIQRGAEYNGAVHEALNGIGILTDIAHHPIAANSTFKERLLTLQAEHLATQYAFDKSIGMSTIDTIPAVNTLRDETIKALTNLPKTQQASVMEKLSAETVERLGILDPHALEYIASEGKQGIAEASMTQLQSLAGHIAETEHATPELVEAIAASKTESAQKQFSDIVSPKPRGGSVMGPITESPVKGSFTRKALAEGKGPRPHTEQLKLSTEGQHIRTP